MSRRNYYRARGFAVAASAAPRLPLSRAIARVAAIMGNLYFMGMEQIEEITHGPRTARHAS